MKTVGGLSFACLLGSCIASSVTSAVDIDNQRNAICYVKSNAPQYVYGELPFSCRGRPEKFVSSVANEVSFLRGSNIITDFDDCVPKIFEEENLIFIAKAVWELRESPVLSAKAAVAFSIKEACKLILSENARGASSSNAEAVEEDLLAAEMDDGFGNKSLHHQHASYDQCEKLQKELKTLKENGERMQLTFYDPPFSGYVVTIHCIDSHGNIK